MSAINCKICGNAEGNKTYTAKEMMFGMRTEFEYMQCGKCGCLQLINIPEDIGKYYPDDYYSYEDVSEDTLVQSSVKARLKRGLKKRVLNSYMQGGSVPQRFAQKFKQAYPWIKPNILNLASKVLDIGCGSGKLLLQMRNDGFKNLAGLDPFIAQDINYKCGVTIHKKVLRELNEKFDLVMMHHAFEHMDHPLEVLHSIHRLLNDGGYAVIRIPVADSYAWEKYGVDWVQLDAPRHFFLHTAKSIEILSKQSGFVLENVVHDSWELQFFGSEKYRKSIPLADKSYQFSEEEMQSFKREAQRLNEAKKGDQACFYLRKK